MIIISIICSCEIEGMLQVECIQSLFSITELLELKMK